MVTPVIAKIISMSPSLTVSENEIAQYVINFPEEVSTSTITSVAIKTNTSEASINRFCKKIGFKGFNKFKIALAQESFYKKMSLQKEKPESLGVISSVHQDYSRMLSNTSAMIDEDVLNSAIGALKAANSINIFAYSTTVFPAGELDNNLNLVGLNTRLATDFFQMRVLASNISQKDLAVLIVPTILIKEVGQVVNSCRERGAKILTITSYDSPQLNELVDFKFVTSDKITAKNSLTISNNLAYLYVADVIFTTLLDSDRVLRQKKLDNDSLLDATQSMPNYMLDF